MSLHMLVHETGTTERVVVEDGMIVTGAWAGHRLDLVRKAMADVLDLSPKNTGDLEVRRVRHAEVLARIAEQVAAEHR